MHVDTEEESLIVGTECTESSSNSSNCDDGAATNQWSRSGKVLRHKIHKKHTTNQPVSIVGQNCFVYFFIVSLLLFGFPLCRLFLLLFLFLFRLRLLCFFVVVIAHRN